MELTGRRSTGSRDRVERRGAGARRVVRALSVSCIVFATVVAVASSPARASDTVIGFDDLPNGTTVTNHYQSQDVTFGLQPNGYHSGTYPVVKSVAAGVATPTGTWPGSPPTTR